MASTASEADALLALRQSIAANTPPIPTASASPASASDIEQDLSRATHLQFNHGGQHLVFPLSSPTRFEASGHAVDLRGIYLAWLRKDDPTTDYIAATRALTEQLQAPGGAGGAVHNLLFAEKLDLITWLEGASEESEFIHPLAADRIDAAAAAAVAAGAAGGVPTLPSGGAPGARTAKALDPRLLEIYNGERRMSDRNSILRGSKPTDFSHIHKHAEAFLGRSGARPAPPTSSSKTPAHPSSAPSVPSNRTPLPSVPSRTKPPRRPEPIILLSPSASSLLRMSNIRAFLDTGVFAPADSTAASPTLLHISRLLPAIDAAKPLRFILVDSPDAFKPDYWARVVAVFTTGQTWQFKGYKWQAAPDLFAHALGVYVGWRGEEVPATVRGWGRGVVTAQIDKFHEQQGVQGRWRDREVVEGIWGAIEEHMRRMGWGKEGAGAR